MNDASPGPGAVLSGRQRDQARRLLDDAVVRFRGDPVGTVAATDPEAGNQNYDQVFVRDFMPVALYYLAAGEPGIVRHFLARTREMQASERSLTGQQPGAGLIPASFKVGDDGALVPDYGGNAIGRVAPVDSSLWWLYLLRVYTEVTGDRSLAAGPEFQQAIKRILELCLVSRFDMYPTLLVPDGSFMVDRRLGVYGNPLEIQVLFYMALRAAEELLGEADDGWIYREAVQERMGMLLYYLRTYYWLDLPRLNQIHRFATEEYGPDAVNAFNIVPESVPTWLPDWLPEPGGFFVGNLGPARMDFRFFSQGNLLAVLSGLAGERLAGEIMALVAAKAGDLIAEMPMKLCYPALEGEDWRIMTGSDGKNVPWSYHNAGSWPVLTWLLAAAGHRTGGTQVAERALAAAADRLERTDWPEYFDGRRGRLVGKEAHCFQSWTAAGVLLADHLLADPSLLDAAAFADDVTPIECSV